MRKFTGIAVLVFACLTVQAQEKNSAWLRSLLAEKGSPLLHQILEQPDTFHYQLIYTKIDRDQHNVPHFTNYFLHVNKEAYFNPASTVKLPTALCALEKINSLRNKGIDKYTTMLTDSAYEGQTMVRSDTSAANGLPSVAHYVKKIFLTSDNDAYNRLYEFDGQQTLNQSLWQKGYPDIRIVRRFAPATEEGNRHTNPIRFMNNGTLVYTQPAAYSSLTFDYTKPVFEGRGHYDKDENLVMTPMDFTRHNNLPLEDLQQLLQSALFPASVPRSKRFNLTKDDEDFLYQYMSQYPSETLHPKYDTSEYFDSYTKFFMFKAGKSKIPANMRVFNKPGWSYGYLTDVAYIADFANHVEFMLTATIYVNSDGIINDDKYDYDTIGYPFFKETGTILYNYELSRPRQYTPDLQRFKLHYDSEVTGQSMPQGAGK
ncbi:serine hydrolase [Deminuibacter soli]|uniref:Beta-lactamase class A catalytic domain-containing protein n=1 Tax=Deminuibacter soli TaxID=2291815 RepID=A0A3E1NIV8_9BACT|nr:serine hydrolase [Deminuibacter soli]RFM27869.1 hypothetical protein DXN05_14345 [Deminuibacter soli]